MLQGHSSSGYGQSGVPWQQVSAVSNPQHGRSSSYHFEERFNIFRPQSICRKHSLSLTRKSRKRKLQLWEHAFCCLASTDEDSPPSAMERARLMQAGLGEKKLSFMENADAEDIHHDLIETFPKLRMGGGYELLCTSERNTRLLDVIPQPPSGYTVTYLKSVAGQAKIYITPLQRNLDMKPTQGGDIVRNNCFHSPAHT